MKSGFVSIVGRPNVGKSTILNEIIGEKISIVSPKSQTTRDDILGIYNDDDSQIIFIDTPGIHKPHNTLGEALDKKAYRKIRESDLALFIIDASRKFDDYDEELTNRLKFDCPVVLVFNKIDLTNINLILSLKELYKEIYPDADEIEICATKPFNIDGLLDLIKSKLEDGAQYYDVNQTTDRDVKFRIQEIIREKCLYQLKDEVPHGVAVICDDIDQSNKQLDIYAKIVVERESQKGIVIGKGGKMIKRIGIASRKDIEALLGRHVNLELRVQVHENWRDSAEFLKKIGYI